MDKIYRVRVDKILTYNVEVEASNEDEAIELAESECDHKDDTDAYDGYNMCPISYKFIILK